MGIDRANIFRLNEEIFIEHEKDPFLDCFESTKDFAKALKNDIDTKETPHSLLLSADYGMGKTFFSTRFTQYLRNNRYDVIYFSVWENDYMQEPFLAFSKAIINYIHNKFKAEKYKANIAKVFETTEKIVESITISTGLGINISSERLINAFKAKTDPIIEFRKQVTSFITKIPKKKLIIIVDELDRCRPDYAMKTLECIKHFFDIEGLFVILPTNINALNNCTKSLYGFESCGKESKEGYFKKFFNDERTIKRPTVEDYSHILKQLLNNDALKEALDKKLLVENGENFNSLKTLHSSLAKYSHSAGLTIREFKDIVMETARLCNNFYESVRTEWLACLMVYRNKTKGDYFNYPLPVEHCFRHNPPLSTSPDKNGKIEALKLSLYLDIFYKLRPTYKQIGSRSEYINLPIYHVFIRKYSEVPKEVNSYNSVEVFLNKVIGEIETIENNTTCEAPPYKLMLSRLSEIKEAIAKQRDIIKQYQDKYGSDDNDSVRENQYADIVQNPERLYYIKSE